MEKYDPSKIESKWQKIWQKQNFSQVLDFSPKEKKYILVEFPYPSGGGLHVGHVWGYTMGDVVTRYYRMNDKNVLFPMGWDAFGLPAENYAIKTGIHPSVTVSKNIKVFKKQLNALGLSFDWSREIDTCDTNYYKWTQWIFLQFFKRGLAYKKEIAINWCPKCKLGLANEEVLASGVHERCGSKVTRRMFNQWLLKITAYADRLVEDLKGLNWPDEIKQQQINWIGKSVGAEINWKIDTTKETISTFTTRLDTIYGATFLVLAPEHPIVASLLNSKFKIQNAKLETLSRYVSEVKQKSELSRKEEQKDKTGVETGLKAIHPLTGEKIPIWVADFVLMDYGTGAIMGVPAHDQRDFEFAKKFNLPIRQVITSIDHNGVVTRKDGNSLTAVRQIPYPNKTYESDGVLINSEEFNGLTSQAARQKILTKLTKKDQAGKKVIYHLRDWVFSRQHYWGEPIPVIFCANCAKNQTQNLKLKAQKEEGRDYILKGGKEWAIVPVPDEDLPVELPYVEKYEPTETGESPLAVIKEWVEVKCPQCGGDACRETDTMPNWAGSSWYYLAYTFGHKLGDQKYALRIGRPKVKNQKYKQENIFGMYKDLIDYWTPVNLYIGGAEHTTLHLLYSRFWHKFLYDLELVPTKEPYQMRVNRGIILGEDHRKMSKSFGNVINPDDVVKEYGADTLRMYELFLGPYNGTFPWNTDGVKGIYRFLNRAWNIVFNLPSFLPSKPSSPPFLEKKLNQLIKKVAEDIENLKFNTAIAAMMEFINDWQVSPSHANREIAKRFLLVLAPFAPHITEELYQKLKTQNLNVKANIRFSSIHQQPWPKYDLRLVKEEQVVIVVQVNGKLREKLEISADDAQRREKVEPLAQASVRIEKYLLGKTVKNVVFVPGKLINFATTAQNGKF